MLIYYCCSSQQIVVVAIELVDTSRFIRVITPESTGWEKVLWWALRGAGANNFGVVTELTFAMEGAPPKTVLFDLHFTTPDECAQALLTQVGAIGLAASR